MPGAEVAVIAFGGSKRAINRRPLDCRAMVAVAVYALPLAVDADCAQLPPAQPFT